VLLDNSEQNRWRREILGYGVAGEFRKQPHGVEYRVLPGSYLASPIWAWLGLAAVRDAYYAVCANLNLPAKFDMQAVSEAINTSNIKLANRIWRKLREELLSANIGPNKDYGLGTDSWAFNPEGIKLFEFVVNNGGIQGFSMLSLITEWTLATEFGYDLFSFSGNGFYSLLNNRIKKNFKSYTSFARSWSPAKNAIRVRSK